MNLVMAVSRRYIIHNFFMFQKTIKDFLTLPLSYLELVLGMLVSGIVRGLMITVALTFVAFVFGVSTIVHPFNSFVLCCYLYYFRTFRYYHRTLGRQ